MFIAFDGDDTLWHNEDQFQLAHREFESALAPWAPAEEVDACLYRTEMRNLPRYGYGVKSFTLSMLETAVEISGGQADGNVVSAIIALGHGLLDRPAALIDGVEAALDSLADHHLLIITKGDLKHQLARVESSGLAQRFQSVEVVAHKDPATYARILDRHRIPVEEFVMIGNSMLSDIAPVAELGGRAVHVPYHVTWSHESDHEVDNDDHLQRITTLADISELPPLIRGWA